MSEKLLAMKHARALAEFQKCKAKADEDTAHYGCWSCDWQIGMDQAIAEMKAIENEMATNADTRIGPRTKIIGN